MNVPSPLKDLSCRFLPLDGGGASVTGSARSDKPQRRKNKVRMHLPNIYMQNITHVHICYGEKRFNFLGLF